MSESDVTQVIPAQSGDGQELGEIPAILCPCGFEVFGYDEEANRWAFGRHLCMAEFNVRRWYDAVFSLWGALVVALLGVAAVGVIKALGGAA